MNVFDEEMGPIAESAECEKLATLSAAGLSLDELRAWAQICDRQVS